MKLMPSRFHVNIEASKSICNRKLILLALADLSFSNLHLSSADDVQILQSILKGEQGTEWNVGHAGTAFRFLTSYACFQPEPIIITGSFRIKERPIHELVNLLRQLGAEITYLDKDGFAPLQINSSTLVSKHLVLPVLKSSQFISSLLLIAPFIKDGLTLEVDENQTSKSYIDLTIKELEQFGVEVTKNSNFIKVDPFLIKDIKDYSIESDWSSASYWFSISSVFNLPLNLSHFNPNSVQGDKELVEVYSLLGIKTKFNDTSLELKPYEYKRKKHIKWDCKNCPDIAQTILVTAFILEISCELTGLETLKDKECDRVVAMQTELKKFGGQLDILDQGRVYLHSTKIVCDAKIRIKTYNDHRMAMAVTPLFMLYAEFVEIENPEVVSKSYPKFWDDLNDLMTYLEQPNN